jgi:phenylalanyl-tRNA synthetase beta chain
MDAMSHLGVVKDVCAYLNNVENTLQYKALVPAITPLPQAKEAFPITVTIENTDACVRYTGITLSGVTIKPSPDWLKNKLLAIGVRPINNIVDITNFILHETGQPLHAFDANAIKGGKIIVKNLPQNTPFVTLDEKERKLDAADLVICNGDGEPMALAGVFGGLHSGVTDTTKNIFLESACFSPASIRPTSFRHGLRTDAAARFEKGVDVSGTVYVLERAAALICELAGGQAASAITDVYPNPKAQAEVETTWAYIKKLSGKYYPAEKVERILTSLGFTFMLKTAEKFRVAVPYSKPDISIAPDIVEEIMRIDGLDNIEIPSQVTITPATAVRPDKEKIREKAANYLAANGFNEIFTNSITNSKYFSPEVLAHTVKMINSLSADLNVMRPSMLETGLESVAHNLNRRNDNLLFFEFGNTYASYEKNVYEETPHLCLYLTGQKTAESWLHKAQPVDFYFLKGYVQNLLQLLGITGLQWKEPETDGLWQITVRNKTVVTLGSISSGKLKQFDIKQPVWFADFNWTNVLGLLQKSNNFYKEIPKFPAVRRDLALILDRKIQFVAVEAAAKTVKSPLLQQLNLFDVFESEKLGTDKKSYAVSFTFQDAQKTLTDKEIDSVMEKLVKAFEGQLNAEIRK